MNKFKVGDKVVWKTPSEYPGNKHDYAEGVFTVKHVSDIFVWLNTTNRFCQELGCYERFKLAKGKQGKPTNTGKEYKVFKTSCNNHEETIRAKNDKEARKQFTKDYKNREGYELHKILITSVAESKVVFK